MLIYFKVGNFKSIKEPVVINFIASSISEHRDTNVAETKRHSLLRTALLYGHNASGKSKLLDALVIMRWFILTSATERQSGQTIPLEPFLLDQETVGQPSFFEASFCVADQTYRYGFEADNTEIHEEWLFESRANDEFPLFLRKHDKVQVDDRRLENAVGLEQRMRNNALFLSVASQWNVQKAKLILQWFQSINMVSGIDDEYYKRTTLELMRDAEMAAEIKAIIRLFNSGKSGCTAQLLAATHDTALLDRDLLRRDQIYFIEKNKYGGSKLTSLAEYKVRKEAPYDKNSIRAHLFSIFQRPPTTRNGRYHRDRTGRTGNDPGG